MNQDAILSKCEAEYERITEIAKSEANVGAINFWEDCEELTSNLLVELDSSLEKLPPTDRFKSVKKKLIDLNASALRQVASVEQMQRENR